MDNKKSVTINVVLNVIKQFCAIVFPLITFPYISRVLGATEYGMINYSASIISYISIIATLGITNYAVRELSKVREDKEKRTILINEIFSINMVSTLIAYAVFILLLVFSKGLWNYRYILIIQVLTVIFTTIGTEWINTAYEDFVYLTIRYIVCQTIAVLLVFCCVKRQEDYLLYTFISIFSGVLANLTNCIYVRRKLGIKVRFVFKLNLKRHLKPIIIMFSSIVASMIYINSDVTILGIIKGDREVGFYSVAAKIYMLIKEMINAALLVLLPRLSKRVVSQSKEKLSESYNLIFQLLIIFLIPVAVSVYTLSKEIVRLVSGEEFLSASSSLQILAIAIPFAVLACYYVYVIMIPLGMEKRFMVMTIISSSVNIVLNIIFIPYYGQNAAAFTTLIAEIIMVVMSVIWTRNVTKYKFQRYIVIAILEFALVLLVNIMIKSFYDIPLFGVILVVAIDILICGILVVIGYYRDLLKFYKSIRGRG